MMMHALTASLLAVFAGLAVTSPAVAASPSTLISESIAATQPEAAQPLRNTKEWNLSSRRNPTALRGYDPVAYFPEGGGKAVEGAERFNAVYRGVTYLFASNENRQRFIANPHRYEPAYGGWCAWAMSKGGKTEIDPKNFIVKDDRLFVFYKGLFADNRKDWKKGNHTQLSSSADGNWRKISDEEPRKFPVKEEG